MIKNRAQEPLCLQIKENKTKPKTVKHVKGAVTKEWEVRELMSWKSRKGHNARSSLEEEPMRTENPS